MTHVRTKDAAMHIEGPDDIGHYWLHLSASGETCRIDLGMPHGMVETALLMAASVKFGRSEDDYTLAPPLQRILAFAKTAPQWDMQADRFAALPAVTVWEDVAKAAIDRAIARLQALPNHAGRPAWDAIVAEEIRAALEPVATTIAKEEQK